MSFIQPIPCDDGGRLLACETDSITICANFEYPEDSLHASGNPGVFVLAVRNDAGVSLADSDGDYTPFTTDATGALRVNASFDGTVVVSLSCDTDSVTVCPGDDPLDVIGTVELGSTTLAALETITVNQGTSPWVIGDGGGSITVDGTVTANQGTSPWVVSGTVTADTNFDYPEDSLHVSGNPGAFVLAVRNDAGTPLAADGDYIPFTTDASGALRVNATFTGDVTVALDCATDSVTVCPGDDPIIVSGTVEATQGTDPWVTSLDATTLAALETITVNQGTNPWTVDGTVELGATTLSALETITVLQGTSPWAIGDGGGSITVDAVNLDIRDLVFATDKVDVTGSTVALDAGSLAALETITVLQGTSPWVIGDGGGSISVDDNGGSITVDGTVTVTQGTSPWVTSLDATSLAALESITVQNGAGAAAVNIQDGGNSITVDGTVAVTQSTSPWVVSGTVTTNQGTSPWVTSLDAASLAALESITVQNGAGAAAVNIQDGGNSITVDGSVTVSGTITTSYQYAEDSPHVSTNVGAFVLAVRNDAGTPLAADQDYIPFTTDATGALRVNAGTTVTQLGRDDTDNQASVSTGLLTSVSRNYVYDGTNWDRWTGAITDGGGSITVDGTVTVTQGTSPWVTSLDATSLAALESITVQNGAGAAAVNIQDGGNSITVDGTVSISGTLTTGDNKIEDAVHVTGDTGSFILAVRNDSNTAFTNNNGDYSPVAVNANGAVAINDGGNSITVDGTVAVSGTVAVTQSTSPWVVSGTVTANQGTSPWVTSLDATSLAALESITVQNPGGASAVNIQDGGNSITVDGSVSITGTVAVTQSTSPWVVSGTVTADTELPAASALADADPNPTTSRIGSNNLVFNGTTWDRVRAGTATGSILVNNGTAANLLATVTIDAASLAALESITVQNPGGASAVNIQDGGNSITVDGTVSVSGTVTVDTNFDYVEDVPHVSGDVGAFVLAVRNDANAALTNTNGDYSPIAVNANGAVAINDGGNSITVDGTVGVTQTTSPWVVSGTVAATQSGSWSVTILNGAGAAAVNIQDGGNSITVDGSVSISGTVAVTQSTSPWVVSGTVGSNAERAEDSGHTTGQTGNFVLGVRNDTASVLTSNDLDYTPFATDSAGRIGISDLGGAVSIDDNGGSITVDGTVSAIQSGAWTVSNNNGAGAAAVNIQDGGNSITVDGTVTITQPTGTITNGAETAVAAVAVQILAANANRKKYFIQNTGTSNIRVGVSGVTATTGVRLVPSGTILMEMPNCPTQAIFAIREGATSSIAFAQEVT